MPTSPPAPRSRRAAPRAGETSAEAVARYVRKLIFDGALEAGQRLPQDEIAKAVGVSRIPVREAIISLEREGWLRVENHRGAFIFPLDARAVTDRFALYGRFYGFAARLAIERMTATDLQSMEQFAAEVARAKTPAAMERANTHYLGAVVSTAASNRLQAVLRSTSQIVPGNFFAVAGSLAIQQRGVAIMQAAISARDVDGAERASVAMQAEQAEAVIAMMTARRAKAERTANT